MYQFKVSFIDSNICELIINGEFQKYVKVEELTRIKADVDQFFHGQIPSKLIPDILLTENSEFNLDLNEEEFEHFKYIFLIGRDRKTIQLTPELQMTSSEDIKKPVIYAYRKLDRFHAYWRDNDNDRRFKLYQQLSQDIIEIPYVDRPLEYECRRGRLAFHPNHGTAHAVRLVTHFGKYLDFMNSSLTSLNPNPLTEMEKSCLELALFLFRSGRTNETSWSADRSYSPRSAAIFSQIADDLGYDKSLINTVAHCFDYEIKIDLKEGFYNQSLRDSHVKVKLYQSLFKAAHVSDLVRCNSNLSVLTEYLKSTLYQLFKNSEYSISDKKVYEFLLLAAKYCKATGAPVAIEELHYEAKSDYYGNPWLMVNSIINIESTFNDLNTVYSDSIAEDTVQTNDLIDKPPLYVHSF